MQEVIPVSKSKPYASVSVKSVDIDALAKSHSFPSPAGAPRPSCVLGVDVAKFELMAVARWPDGSFARPWRIVNPDEIALLIARLNELGAACPGLVVAMESSGTYGDALRQALSDAAIALQRVSAKAVKDQAETFDGVPSQHDGKDAAIIADLCARGKGRPWEMHAGSQSDQEIRYWVRRLDAAQRIKQMWGGKVEGLLARHWPEVTRLIKRTTGATLSKTLARWGGPAALAADPQGAQTLRRFGGRFLTDVKIAALIASAKTTGGLRASDWETREIMELAGRIVGQRKEIATCKRQLRKLTRDHQTIAAQTPALGLVTACVLWTHLGDPRDYDSAAAYRKAMGLNLVEHSSGRFKGKLRLSKRGQRLTRKWLYFSALRWMRDPAVKPWVKRKKSRDGGKGMRAMVGVMRRLALAAWNVGACGEAFDAGRLFPGRRVPRPVTGPASSAVR